MNKYSLDTLVFIRWFRAHDLLETLCQARKRVSVPSPKQKILCGMSLLLRDSTSADESYRALQLGVSFRLAQAQRSSTARMFIRWARRKFKRMRHQSKGARDWFDRLRRAYPTLFAHWALCHGNGRTPGAV
jgi:hypothetical protein